MLELVDLFQQWVKAGNLLGVDSQSVLRLVEARSQALQHPSASRILIVESKPDRFLAGFIAACAQNCLVCLGNPNWTAAERQQVVEQIQPDVVWSDVEPIRRRSSTQRSGWVLIPTGGSSGQIRFAIHTWETLTASVQGFQQYFGCAAVNSCGLLPLYHVSGLMQFMRSLLSNGKLAVASEPELLKLDPSDFFLSLVPTQLQRKLQHPEAIVWLSQVQTVLLGGAPAWSELLETAKQHQIRLAPTYGMTETASQVATLKPDQFLQGKSGCGQLLPHAQLQIVDEAGQLLQTGQVGTIVIQATSLALGYYEAIDRTIELGSPFRTDDLGYFDSAGDLQIVGRSSRKIITGGENVFPDQVEAALGATGLVADVCVVGLPDRDWGEVVTAFYVPSHPGLEWFQLQAAIVPALSKFKQPKRWLAVESLPRNAQGKINYEEVKTLGC